MAFFSMDTSYDAVAAQERKEIRRQSRTQRREYSSTKRSAVAAVVTVTKYSTMIVPTEIECLIECEDVDCGARSCGSGPAQCGNGAAPCGSGPAQCGNGAAPCGSGDAPCGSGNGAATMWIW